MLGLSILSLSTNFLFDFRTVPTVWYFRILPTVWYFRTVPTVWYFMFFILLQQMTQERIYHMRFRRMNDS